MDSSMEQDDKGWTPDLIDMLEKWQDEAMGWAYIYRMTARYHGRVHMCMFVTSLVFSVVGGIGAIVSSVVSSVFDRYPWMSIAFSVCALIGASITGIDDQLLKSADKASACHQTHIRWLNIPRKIQIELKKQNVAMRIEGNIFSRSMEQEFAKTLDDSPNTPERYLKSWIRLRNKYRKSGSRIGNASPIQVFSGEVPPYSSRGVKTTTLRDASPEELRMGERVENFSGAPTERVVTVISNEVDRKDKFDIELSLKKLKTQKRSIKEIKPVILSPYHSDLVLDTREYLELRYPPAETV